jgi:hypothetical protein
MEYVGTTYGEILVKNGAGLGEIGSHYLRNAGLPNLGKIDVGDASFTNLGDTGLILQPQIDLMGSG